EDDRADQDVQRDNDGQLNHSSNMASNISIHLRSVRNIGASLHRPGDGHGHARLVSSNTHRSPSLNTSIAHQRVSAAAKNPSANARSDSVSSSSAITGSTFPVCATGR